MKKILPIIVTMLAIAVNTVAQTTVFNSQYGRWFWETTEYYRIPAILNQNGKLWAFTDDRTAATGDIGSGKIKIIAKTSTDGSTWSSSSTIADYSSSATSGFDYAHGDAAVVCDRENTNNMLMMCASGSVAYGNSSASNPIRVGRYVTTDGGSNWTETEVTNDIYNIWSSSTKNFISKLFFSSGRICQSALIKNGDYYRLYAALCTNVGSLVVYSDNFGNTWNALGGVDAVPVPNGDEAKIEELPNGNVLISSRTRNKSGRYYNIYTYTDKDKAEGSWGNVATASIGSTNDTNGEILLVPAMASGSNDPVYIALQSVPTGTDRENVSIYWKVLTSVSNLNEPSDFQSGWTQYQVSTTTSAYSTMTLDNSGNIAFLYEETYLSSGDCYDIKFQSLSLETITSNAYTYTTALDEDSHRTAFLSGSTIQDPWEGKVVTLKAKLEIPDGDTKYFYLHNEGLNLKVEETEPTLTDYSYYWVISKDPGTSTYYLSSLKGDGYLGKGYGRDYSIEDENADGAYKNNIPVCTDDYTNTFEITGFVKQETVSEDAAVLMDGYAIKFVSGNSYRYVAVSEGGAINWFDHTAKGEYSNSDEPPYWTTDFEITEVERVYTPGTYGTWDKPTHFGFPIKMTRSEDNKGNTELEGYCYYATLKLPFAVDLTKENVKDRYNNKDNVSGYDLTVLTCEEKKQNVGEKVILGETITTTLKADGSYTLPRETPIMLRMGDRNTPTYQETHIPLYLQPTFAKPIIKDTGFKGTLGQKTFTDAEYNPADKNFFILGKKSDGRIKFYYLSDQTLAANKAYYVYDTTTGAKPTSLVFCFTDDSFTTGITQPETIEPDTDGIIYDLSGRRITSAVKKGIYIRDGKKYIVK